MINWEALDRIEAEYRQLQNLFPTLSSRYVGGEGDNPQAFIIGEAPGATEAMKLRPFVGDAGRVLRQLLDIADLHVGQLGFSDNCWLTNVCKFRPPKNRTPTEMEIKAFRPLLMDEWRAVGAPRLIIAIGGTALRAVTGKYVSILRSAGKCHWYTSQQGKKLAIWPMIHPAFGLRNPGVQPMLEQDWELLGEWRKRNADFV